MGIGKGLRGSLLWEASPTGLLQLRTMSRRGPGCVQGPAQTSHSRPEQAMCFLARLTTSTLPETQIFGVPGLGTAHGAAFCPLPVASTGPARSFPAAEAAEAGKKKNN